MNNLLPLLPEPEQIHLSGGSIDLRSLRTVRFTPDSPELRLLAAEISREIARVTKSDPVPPIGPEGTHDAGTILRITLDPDQQTLGHEGYRISVGTREMVLLAATNAGLSHAKTTFVQILPSGSDADTSISCLEILDRPRFPWRGMHLDVVRHFFPAEKLTHFIDLLAIHKFNRFHLHLTDDQGWRLGIPGHPRLTEIGARRVEPDGSVHEGFYTRDQIRAIVAHAAERNITVVPEIELPGHAMAALAAYPERSCAGGAFQVPSTWGIFEDVFCAGKEATFTLLEDVLTEVASLFPGPYVHIGGDECPTTRWSSCADCRRRIEGEGLTRPEELQGYFIRRIAALPAMRGRRLIGWDEVADAAPPTDTIVMSWRGTAEGIAAVRAGHDVIMCPTEACYFDSYQGQRETEPEAFPRDVPLEAVYDFDPIPGDLPLEENAQILGAQGNIWTEHITSWPHLEYMTFPRACALAEVLWSPAAKRDWNGFRERLAGHLRRLDGMGVRYRIP